MGNEPRFIVDNMLGTVARWLRILGYDAVYDREVSDWQILRRAELEKRIVVTRDRALHNRAIKLGLRSIFLWEDDMASRLAHISAVVGIRLAVDFEKTRCPEDNTPLVKVSRDAVKDSVPPSVYRLHSDFWKCPTCGKAYWVGSHWKMIERILGEARKKLESYKEKMRT